MSRIVDEAARDGHGDRVVAAVDVAPSGASPEKCVGSNSARKGSVPAARSSASFCRRTACWSWVIVGRDLAHGSGSSCRGAAAGANGNFRGFLACGRGQSDPFYGHHTQTNPSQDTTRKPAWLRARLPSGPATRRSGGLVDRAQAPHRLPERPVPEPRRVLVAGTATVMIFGNICTRSCNFCAVQTGRPTELDLGEPARVAEAVATMGLRHCVITSVARDELADGGASVWAATIRAVRSRNPATAIEVLVPDFKGRAGRCRHGARREAGHLQPQRRDRRAPAEAGPGPGPLRPVPLGPAPCEIAAASP